MSRNVALGNGPSWLISLIVLCLGFWPVAGFGLNPAHECSYCHDVHSADGVTILAEQEVEVLCLTCHISGALDSAPDADVHTNKTGSAYADFRATCLDCHNPHDNLANWIGDHEHIVNDPTDWGINIKLVGSAGSDGVAMIQSLEWDATMGEYLDGIRYVVFEQLGDDMDPALQIHSFSDENMDGLLAPDGEAKDGPCEVCHNQTKYHCNGDDSNIGACGTEHNTGRNCTLCHDHAANFLPQSGGGGRP